MIFCPDNNHSWMASHASNPVAEPLEGDVIRVYFSCRDKAKRSSIAFLEFDINRPERLLRLSDKPVLTPGSAGLFDDSGVSMGCIVENGDKRRLYYIGWNLCVTVPWRNSIGLAVARGDDAEFVKYSRAPIMDRSREDPFSLSYPWVAREEQGWKMWYGSNLTWGTSPGDMLHVIKYARSSDGVTWERGERAAISLRAGGSEIGVSRPCVIRDEGVYRMWYSIRDESYRIGYAESPDGVRWTRKDDEAGISTSESGWDSEMIEYPCVFDHRNKRYMLYCGNDYGKTGFGLAVFDESGAGAS